MENYKIVLIIVGGIVFALLFGLHFLMSLDRQAPRFFKYLLINLTFITAIGMLLYLFPNASVYITLLAISGWMILAVVGSRKREDKPQEPDEPD